MYILEMHQLEFFFLLESVAFLHWQHIEKVKSVLQSNVLITSNNETFPTNCTRSKVHSSVQEYLQFILMLASL